MALMRSKQLVFDQIVAVLTAWGMKDSDAGETASIMVDADLAGIDSHGISMLPSYRGLVDSGAIDLTSEPEVVSDTESAAVVDGHHNLGHRTSAEAMRVAMTKAEHNGIGSVAVRKSRHFGAAGYYAAMAAERGLIGLVTTTTRTRAMVPSRGTRPVLGTNPIAFAAPTAKAGEPFVLDMSTSTVAVNKVKVFNYRGEALPAGWMSDSTGHSVTDSQVGYSALLEEAGAGLTPLGATDSTSGHKGYGLAVMVQILAGALAGISFDRSQSEAAHEGVGHFFLAIEPGFFGDRENFLGSVSEIVDSLRNETPTDSDRPVLVAGDPERTTRAQRSAEGIPLSEALVDALEEVCSLHGAEFLLGEKASAVSSDR